MDTMILRYPVVSVWILVEWIVVAAGAPERMPFSGLSEEGQMRPIDPLVETNTTLALNCTLSDKYSGPYTADDIYFRLGNETYSSDHMFVTVIDPRTSALHLPNVQRTISGKNIFCYIPDVKYRLGQQVLTVADRPVLPRLVGCRVYNWRSMTCTWEPEKQDTGIPTDTQLYWTVLMRPPVHWLKCPNRQKEVPECHWKYLDPPYSLKTDMPHYIHLSVNNSLGETLTNISLVETKYQGRAAPKFRRNSHFVAK